MELTVRPASDVEAVHALLTECGVDMRERLGLSHWVPAYPLHLVRAQSEAGDVHEVVGREEGLIATFTVSDRSPSYYREVPWDPAGEPAVYVTRLAVRPAKQGRGIGSWCMEWIETEASRRAAASVRLDAYTEHHLLLRFYRRLDYAERGTLVVAGRPMTCFEKLLGERA